MSRIKKTNTKPEILVRKFLLKKGFRYRIHVKLLPGNPDVVLPKYKVVIFINGCFWHAHNGCKLNRMPKTRTDYWVPKINGNVERDKIVGDTLQKLGWRVIAVWECGLKKDLIEHTLNDLVSEIKQGKDE